MCDGNATTIRAELEAQTFLLLVHLSLPFKHSYAPMKLDLPFRSTLSASCDAYFATQWTFR